MSEPVPRLSRSLRVHYEPTEVAALARAVMRADAEAYGKRLLPLPRTSALEADLAAPTRRQVPVSYGVIVLAARLGRVFGGERGRDDDANTRLSISTTLPLFRAARQPGCLAEIDLDVAERCCLRPAARVAGPLTSNAERDACSSRTWSLCPCQRPSGACRRPGSRDGSPGSELMRAAIVVYRTC